MTQRASRCKADLTVPTGPRARDYRAIQLVLRTMTEEERFWFKVQKSDGCWLWLGARDKDGYGLATMHRDGRSILRRATRVAYELACGQLLPGRLVCHSCDNPPCVRPSHLFLGTYGDNAQDAQAKGRVARGTRNTNNKLTESQVVSIRRSFAEGIARPVLAREYGISWQTVDSIVKRRLWRHVA